jgi:PKHD-type hydroxylase
VAPPTLEIASSLQASMDYRVIRLLKSEEAAAIVAELARCDFKDGKLTAYGLARKVKNNLQLRRSDAEGQDLHQRIAAAFHRSAELQNFTFSNRFACPMFNRYEAGMAYGAHVDDSMMGGFNGIRTDFSITVFLSPPASYEGGELVVELPAGEEAVKLDAGEAIVYSGGLIHRVAPVTKGVRLAAVSWMQSLVRDVRLRNILQDLLTASKRADEAQIPELVLLLNKSYHNLLRYAAES